MSSSCLMSGRDFLLVFLILLVFIADCTTTALSLSTPPSFPQQQQSTTNKKKNPLVDRRKSPALWRLLYNDDDDAHDMKLSPRQHHTNIPEIMSPAGGWPQVKAAVANGADAVYVGLTSFSARARATNFDLATELPDVVAYCHFHNIHVYVALNTLVYDHELEEISHVVQQLARLQVDAVIVQDLGTCRLIRDICRTLHLKLPIHSSTQQSVTSADGVDFCVQQHGAERVVVGRELSVTEIESVARSASSGVQLETFVHGALCVSYSGQCFSSQAWGGRSANRGQCAQACRLPYGLVVDGTWNDSPRSAEIPYVLSPQDLCGLDQMPALVRAGVSCLKIEGRLKDKDYVAATTRAYRQAVDQAWQEIYGDDATDTNSRRRLLARPDVTVTRAELTQLFSRGQDEEHGGLTPGFLDGTHHQRVVRGRSPRHRGVHLGRVVAGSAAEYGIVVQLTSTSTTTSIQLGDGIVVDRGRAELEELGGPIFDIREVPNDNNNNDNDDSKTVVVQLSRDAMAKWKRHDKKEDSLLVPVGAHIWKTHDAVVDKKFVKLSQAELPPPLVQVQARVRGQIGHVLELQLQLRLQLQLEGDDNDDNDMIVVRAQTESPLEPAQRRGISPEQVKKAIGSLGDTEFQLEEQDIDLTQLQLGPNANGEEAWCPVSQIKQARRHAVQLLEEQVAQKCGTQNGGGEEEEDATKLSAPLQHGIPDRLRESLVDSLQQTAYENDQDESSEEDSSREKGPTGSFSVLCRNLEQVNAICSLLEENSDTQQQQENLVSEIMIDFLEVDGMREAAQRVRALPSQLQVEVVVASPRILKPKEGGIWKTLLALEPDALLVRSTGLLHRLQKMGGQGAQVNVGSTGFLDEEQEWQPSVQTGPEHWVAIPRLIGDFSLNAANALTACELLGNGLDRVTASYDLNARGIADMASLLGPVSHQLEVVAHCKMPIFHTEHCVFARFLTNGDSYLDCGHACTRHSVHLRDEMGLDNLVLADMGCRNTVFGAQAQSGVHSLKPWRRAGIEHYRIELVDEQSEDAGKIVQTYLQAWKGDISSAVAWDRLQECRDSNGRVAGVTLGSLKNVKERRAGELSAA